jgi:hypothetical protein
MHDHEASEVREPAALTEAVRAAQSGFRRDVQALIDALEDADLLVPLAEHIPEARLGEAIEIDQPVAIQPHMLLDPEGAAFCCFFTEVSFVERIAEELAWTTSEGDLELCTIFSGYALQMALSVIDGVEVKGLVMNPGSDSELVLSRDEVASMAQGQALPLVGYVDDIEAGPDDTLLAEPADPPPAELLEALERVKGAVPGISDLEVRRTFNPDRDREPHLTVTVKLGDENADRERLARRVSEAVEGKVPPPGYIDILFE